VTSQRLCDRCVKSRWRISSSRSSVSVPVFPWSSCVCSRSGITSTGTLLRRDVTSDGRRFSDLRQSLNVCTNTLRDSVQLLQVLFYASSLERYPLFLLEIIEKQICRISSFRAGMGEHFLRKATFKTLLLPRPAYIALKSLTKTFYIS